MRKNLKVRTGGSKNPGIITRARKVILQIAETMQETVQNDDAPETMREIWKNTGYEGQLTGLCEQLQHLPARETVAALAGIHHNLGVLYALQGNYQRAMEEFEISLGSKQKYYRMLSLRISEKRLRLQIRKRV